MTRRRSIPFAILLAAASAASAQEIGFIETFSLSTNRETALKELVPGTDEYYYFHGLHYQNTGQRDLYQQLLDRWIRQNKGAIVAEARELMNRQALLDYEKDPPKTLDYIRRELDVRYPHARKTGERRSSAPSQLDPERLRVDLLLQKALATDPRTIDRVEDAGLDLLADAKLSDEQRRNLLARLERPDYPGLADLVAADLRYRDSRGFGHHPIHARMLLAQLDQLLQTMPELRNQSAFVNAYLSKLPPEDEVDLDTDPAARQAYYDRVWAFVQTLDPVHNSLKANALYNRLRHDRGRGVYDKARFLEYLRLPREVPWLRDEFRRSVPRAEQMARMDQDFGLVALPPVADEGPLVRDFLMRFLVEAPNADEFKTWLRDDFLKIVFAEAKIVNGIGDPESWASLLSPEAYKALKERVDLDLVPDNPAVVGPDDAVTLKVLVKNVPSLMVKVFEINTFNYYRETGRPLNLAIALDGLVASAERRETYREPPERRVERVFEFPELKGRGTYVVEFIGNGRSSRALVQKGQLRVLQEVTPAGHAFAALDEAGRRLPDATIWLAGREYAAGADGRIVVPFSTAPGPAPLVVRQGGFASLVRFDHLAEGYELRAGFYVDRESLLRRGRAPVVVRPVLLVNGQPASLKLLEDVRLVVSSVDGQGIATEKEFPGFALREDAESVQEFPVAEDLAAVSFTLRAKVQNVSRNEKQDLAAHASFALNGIDRGPAVQDLHLRRAAGGYTLDLRGKNGEPRAGEPVFVSLKHRMFRDEIHVELQTDAAGAIALGPLPGIDSLRAKEPAGAEHTWFPARDANAYPAEIHGRAGDVLRLAFAFESADLARDASLLEERAGGFVKDWHDALAVKDGFLELRGLPAGDYSLLLKPDGATIAVRVTAGEDRDGFIFSGRRALQRPRLAPLQIVSAAATPDALEIRLANATPFARVHVFAARYRPACDLFGQLGDAGAPGLLQQPWRPARTFYESGRDIGDEYRYVIDRRAAPTFAGNLLDRPGLLLNPWAVRSTEAERERLEEGAEYAGRAATAQQSAALRRLAGKYALAEGSPGAEETDSAFANLDFLARPAAALINLRPDAAGVVRIPRADLTGHPNVRILAADPTTSVFRDVALDDTPVETRELRLAEGLDPATTYSEQKLVTPVTAGGALAVADVTTSKFEIYDTLSKAWTLLNALNGDATFQEFEFVLRWPDLDAAERARLYSKYACHELNFFLYRRDPEFFRAVIAPYLKNKKDKTFLDRWLVGEDVSGYLEPWRFARLNAVERILLGRRVKEQAASIARDARERDDLIPPDMEDFNRRFDTAIRTGAMEADGGRRESALDEARNASRDAGAEQLKRMESLRKDAASGLMPATVAAAAAPPPAPMGAPAKPGEDSRRGAAADRLALAGGEQREAKGKAEMSKEAAEKEADGFFDADVAGFRAKARRLFQKLDQTKEWAENNYYHLTIDRPTADLVPMNAFWADYAAHDGSGPFLSPAFPQATRNFTEMMLALAALDLPFKAGAHGETVDGIRYEVRAATPLVAFHREIREARRAEEPSPVLVSQQFFRADDRYRFEGNERYEKYVTDEFLPHVVYGAQVILTNPTGRREKLQLLLQIPMGAMPVQNGPYTRGAHVVVEPYSTQTAEYHFYFPATGRFAHYPVTVARDDRVLASAAPFAFNVVERLTQIDKTSWAWISQNGTLEEVLAHIAANNVLRLDLGEIAWRMKDRDAFSKITAALTARHVYDQTLWSYGLMHNDPAAIREYLRHSPFAERCGLWLASPLLALDPVERAVYEHLEYAPLVNPRAHPVGAKPRILNTRFLEQYRRFMKVLSYKAAIPDADELAVAYYLMLQDRVSEALAWFARVDRKAVPEQVQADYLETYLAVSRGDLGAARRLAEANAKHPVDRWRQRFEQVRNQLEELEKGVAAAADAENRDQAQGALAATEPSLEMQVEAGRIRLDHRNLRSCVLNFYPMDIELLFSRSPFLQEGSAQFSFIRPVLTRNVELAAGKETTTLDLPAEFRTRNVMVEALGAGVRRTQAYYANTLRVQMIEAYGQLAVAHAETRKPLAKAYVKVYARMNGGEVRFFKDGYTDFRGRFDYVSLNTNELDNVDRLSVLVLSDEFGAVVREAAPPKR